MSKTAAYTTTVTQCNFEVEEAVIEALATFNGDISSVTSLVGLLSQYGYDLIDMNDKEFTLDIDVENGITLRIRVPRD